MVGAMALLALGCGPSAAESERAQAIKDSLAADSLAAIAISNDEDGDQGHHMTHAPEPAGPGEVEEFGFVRPDYKSDADRKALGEMEEEGNKRLREYLVGQPFRDKVAALKETEDMDGMPVYGKLPDDDFKALSAAALVYYAAYHPEEWYQICAEYLYDVGDLKGVFSYLPIETDEPSERQVAALKAKKQEVADVVTDFLVEEGHAPLPLLRVIVSVDLREAIPALCNVYKDQAVKDDLILTTLIELMNSGGYKPIDQLYADPKVNPRRRDWLPMDDVTADKILYHARKFANS